MFSNLDEKVIKWANTTNPFTNVYGFARSLIALSLVLTLLFNDSGTFFRPVSGVDKFPNCINNSISIFCMVPSDYLYLEIVKWICIILLVIVISGWKPRYTGIIHWWITYSFWESATTLDGGEQVATVLTLLLIPITLCDPRKNHWEHLSIKEHRLVTNRIIASLTLHLMRIQIAILYFHSTVAKLINEEWINGTAVWYYVQSPMLGTPIFLEDFILSLLSTPFVVVPTWGTLIMQTVLVCALFSPKKYRPTILVFALLMHEIFAIFLGLISFSIVMLGALILYLRPLESNYAFKFHGVKKVLMSLKHIYLRLKKGVKYH